MKHFLMRISTGYVLVLLAAYLTACNGQPVAVNNSNTGSFTTDTSSGNGSYKLVWSDEFNKNAVNTGVWSFENGNGTNGWGNNELEYYTGRSENVKADSGYLVITARKENYRGMNYTSARIKTKGHGDWRYGKFVARMKLPTGKGMWPAFWLMPTQSVYGSWPHSGEIDIMEMIGDQPSTVYGTAHYGAQTHHQQGCHTSLDKGTLADGFHTYSLEWTPDSLKWYLDGKQYCHVTRASIQPDPWPFDQQFYIILNLAVGGNWPGNPSADTKFPQSMLVDYVRVYQKK